MFIRSCLTGREEETAEYRVTNAMSDENTKQTIKGILGSFTFIDLDQCWVKGLFRVQWCDSLDRKTTK